MGEHGRVMCELLKGRRRENVVGERAVVGPSTVGERGREVRDAEGANGWGPRGREKEHACAGKTVPIGLAHRAARERERGDRAGARARGMAPTGLAHWAAGEREGRERAGEAD
jgi:hypothetical protein